MDLIDRARSIMLKVFGQKPETTTDALEFWTGAVRAR
jgi:hypothetical protein